jgi:ribosomal protein L14E/L6E/L27E
LAVFEGAVLEVVLLGEGREHRGRREMIVEALDPEDVAGVREAGPTVRMEMPPFKVNVRKLKALGLTESLEIGYCLSDRGRAWLARLG